MSLTEELRAARQALTAGRFDEFAERALRLETASVSWTSQHDSLALRGEAETMASVLGHFGAVRDRLIALRGGDGAYRADGSVAPATPRGLRREA